MGVELNQKQYIINCMTLGMGLHLVVYKYTYIEDRVKHFNSISIFYFRNVSRIKHL